MSTPAGNLSVWVGHQAACVRVAGRANFATSVDLKRLVQHLQDTGHPRVVLDLSPCLLMDSTFLGVLVHVATQRARWPDGFGASGLELFNPNPRVRELIESLGVSHFFKFLERDLSQEAFEAAPPAGSASREELTRTCLEAHELLMALNPANVAKFQDAARYFAEELKHSTSAEPKRS